MPALRIKIPNSGETTHVLRGEKITIGRSPDNTIQIPHGSVSSYHAEFLSVEGGFYRLHDLQSTNRSFVEGEAVTDVDLNASCKILFGSVECEFDPSVNMIARRAALPPAKPPQVPPDAFLESENRDLRDRVHALQRRFDILSSARLVTGKTDLTPYATGGDSLRETAAERDDLRRQCNGLKQQVERLQSELAVTVRERDAARNAAEALQAERAKIELELKKTQVLLEIAESERPMAPMAPEPPAIAAPVLPPPPRPPAVSLSMVKPPPPPGVVALKPAAPEPPAALPVAELPAVPAPVVRPPDLGVLAKDVEYLNEAVLQLAVAPSDPALSQRVREAVEMLFHRTLPLDKHAFVPVVRALHEFTRCLAEGSPTPSSGTLRTLRRTTEFFSRLVEPSFFAAGQELPRGEVLTVDDDADLLATITAAIKGTGLNFTGCTSAEEALVAIDREQFDAIIADVRLPGMNGPAFCAHARSLPAYRRTPILFLTVADTLDKRAETSLSGGSEFIAKPFNVFELALKVETWVLKHQLRLL